MNGLTLVFTYRNTIKIFSFSVEYFCMILPIEICCKTKFWPRISEYRYQGSYISSPYVLQESQKKLTQCIQNIFHIMEFLQRWNGNVIPRCYRQGLFKIHYSSTHTLFFSKCQYININSLEDLSCLCKRSTGRIQNKQRTKWHSTKLPHNNSLSSAYDKYMF